MRHAPKTVSTCLAVLALGLCLAAPAGALAPSFQPEIAPVESGAVSLGRLLDVFSGWLVPWNDPGTVTTIKCSDPAPPEGEDDDTCGTGQAQDPNGSSGSGTGAGSGAGGTGSGTPGG